MQKKTKRLILLLLLLILLAGAVGVLLFYMPYRHAQSAMPQDGQLRLETQSDGSLLLRWPQANIADYYCVELFFPARSEKEEPGLAYQAYEKNGCAHTLPHLPANQELTLQVNTVVEYETAGEVHQRRGQTPLEITTVFQAPEIRELSCLPEPEGKKIILDYALESGDQCNIYAIAPDGAETLLATTDQTHMEFTVGEFDYLPLPEYGQEISFRLEPFRVLPGLRFDGIAAQTPPVCREDLLGREPALQLSDNGNNMVTLSWQQTKGAYYEVQQMDLSGDRWSVLARIDRTEPCTFTTRHLPACHDYLYRVVAVGGQVMEGSEIAALSEEIPFSSVPSPIYCTVWPVNNLAAYTDSAMTQAAGNVTAGKAYCVLEERDGAFGIRLDGQLRFIDSNYCMINLPEYLGPLCAYNISNSYSSLYMVHEYAIPQVTGEVTVGYDRVRMADGSYLVPLLYPTAQKLETAAREARSRGFRLKIYDSYRPYRATREIYDLTKKVLEEPLPERSYTGRYTAPEEMTYEDLMTGGSWSLGSFLAAGGSMHNLGIALDLTLEDLTTGEELKMQSSMHDLSCYSVLSRNNASANTLSAIMKNAGLNELVSEWWHFQDNEARDTLKLPTVYDGVTPECWMADGMGWKYRRVNGTYFENCQRQIDGVVWTFDENGYVVEDTAG